MKQQQTTQFKEERIFAIQEDGSLIENELCCHNDTIDYVGYFNGCRVALSSLSSYQESGKTDAASVVNSEGSWVDTDLEGSSGIPIVDTFIGVACPAELNDGTFLSAVAQENILSQNTRDIAMASIWEDHITMRRYTGRLFVLEVLDGGLYVPLTGIASIFPGNDKISRNLMDYYNDLAIAEDSDFDLSGLNIGKLRLHTGNMLFLGHDGVVPVDDMQVILDEVNSENKGGEILRGVPLDVDHISIKNKNMVKDKILEELR